MCKDIAIEQKKRLKKYCRVYIHKNEKINCKVIITNWDTSILDYVNETAKKYTVLHTDYSNPTERQGLPIDRPDITYIGITEYSKKKFEEISGINRTILCRNPLEIDEEEPMLTLVSATRLTKIKDDGRHLQLAKALETAGIKFVWYIFTTNEYNNNPLWNNKNIIHMDNRLELGEFIRKADWYVQLSSCEGDSYSLKESLYRGTPIVVCELPYFKEIGIKNNKNALFYNIDNSNANEVAKKMKKPLTFTFKHVEDGYNEILDKRKSKYKEELKMKYLVKATKEYENKNLNDAELGYVPKDGEEFEVTKERLDVLLGDNDYNCKFVEVVKELSDDTNLNEEDKNLSYDKTTTDEENKDDSSSENTNDKDDENKEELLVDNTSNEGENNDKKDKEEEASKDKKNKK